MIISETTILWLCFLITFGFLGFKLTGLVKKTLDNYALKIDKRINDSENLKIKAINTLEKAKSDLNSLNIVIDKNNKETDLKMMQMNKKFEEKIEKMISKMTEENEKQQQYEMEIMVNDAKEQIKNIVSSVVKDLLNEEVDKNNGTAMQKSVVKVDFKKLLEN